MGYINRVPLFSRRTILRGLILVSAEPLAETPSAMAAESSILSVGGSSLDVELDSDGFDLSRAAIMDWVATCAKSVAAYIGKFPVPHARVQIVSSERGRGVNGGRSWGEPEARCRITINRHTTAEDLHADWILTHEMLHFAFPSMPRQNSWIEEGVSTYVEPIARANAGVLTGEEVWAGLVRGLPQGLPDAGDQGLDVTHTWGRTYWGGALFCLLSDIGIRKGTSNRAGLRDALRGINTAGGNITVEWPLSRALELGDRATKTTVLTDLHKAMGSSAHPVDLSALWVDLGVIVRGEVVTFDNRALLAWVRKAILP